MIGIYKITSPSGKIYIGQSNNVEKRLKGYLKEYKCMSSQKRLYNSFLKYGSENHIFEIIDECTIELLNERERFWQEYYNSIGLKGLNCILTQTSEKKRVLSNETRIKLSKSLKGKLSGEKNPMYGKFGSLNHFYGKKHTEETKKILKEKNSGVNHVFYGKKRPEHSVKMSGKNHYMYGKKSELTSEINRKRIGLLNSNSKILLDINSGVFYYCFREYCDLYNISISTFRYNLKNNKIKNIIKV
jgi:group I intron endonuclease